VLYFVRTLDPYGDGLDISIAEIARQLSTDKRTVHRSTVSRALKELDAKGFIDMELLTGLRHFLAPLGAKNPSQQGKEVDDLKMPETLVTTGFMPIRAKTLAVARFEAIFSSVFV
jgi:hypothetical protein